ncbi:MAG: PxKF domain-containing protein, partial [Planctomycetales bacterium]|nr:PxKF domain-containing protein [Planctomycetales bacterium]
VDVVINKANQTISWIPPAPIGYGTPLSDSQLNATVAGVAGGSTPGTLTYTPGTEAILLPGTHTLSVTAAETANYLASSATVPIVVNPYTSGGFLQPITTNRAFKQGSTIPIKWQVQDASGQVLTSLVAISSLSVFGPNGVTLLYPGNNGSSGSTVLRNDDGQFIFNWHTKGFALGSYIITVALVDGTTVTDTILLSKTGPASGLGTS